MPGGEAAPTGRVKTISAPPAPNAASPAETASPSWRLPAGPITETSTLNLAGVGLAPAQELPARTAAPAPIMYRYETRLPHDHGAVPQSLTEPRIPPRPITAPDVAMRQAGLDAVHLKFEHHTESMNPLSEQGTRAHSPIPHAGHSLHHLQPSSAAPVGASRTRPAYRAPVGAFQAPRTYDTAFVREEPDRADSHGDQEVAPSETLVRDASPTVSKVPLRPVPHKTDANESTHNNRAAYEHSAEGAAASVKGTVFLDETSFGRWVIDHLTREVTRPTSGMTGFDPRITASYPGAPIGG